jgi:integrase
MLLSDDGSATGMIQVVDGKSKAARRVLPMTPHVYALLKARHEAGGFPREGWIFPTASREDHLTIDAMAKMQRKKALEISSVTAFPPYTLRHTALTRLGEAAGGDVLALARIAGHSSITITQRYVHPQAETIDRVFAKALQLQKSNQQKTRKRPIEKDQGTGTPEIRRLGTELGTGGKSKNLALLTGGQPVSR